MTKLKGMTKFEDQKLHCKACSALKKSPPM